MKKGNYILLMASLLVVLTVLPASTSTASELTDKKDDLFQPCFTYITIFSNDFYITEQGKAVLTSLLSARNVDACEIVMHLE